MRLVSSIICLLICYNILGQSDFKNQLDIILKDTTNRFKNIAAGFKQKLAEDSVFNTATSLEGTTNNEVIISNAKSTYIVDSYMADIAKSISEKEGRRILDEWKNKILNFIGSEFRLVKINSNKYKSQSGWSFEKDIFTISIVYIKSLNAKDGLVILHISYPHIRKENMD